MLKTFFGLWEVFPSPLWTVWMTRCGRKSRIWFVKVSGSGTMTSWFISKGMSLKGWKFHLLTLGGYKLLENGLERTVWHLCLLQVPWVQAQLGREHNLRKIFLARYVAVSTCIGTTIGDAGQTMNLPGTLCSGGSFGLDQLLIFHWWRSSLRMLARWLKGTVKLQRAARTLYSLANRTLLCEGIWGRRGLLFGD